MTIEVKEFFDHETATFTYVVFDPKTKVAALIDSVLNYDIFSGKFSTKSADEVISYIDSYNLKLEWILETHIHADHITASNYIKNKFPDAKTAIGENIREVLKFWVPFFNIADDVKLDGSQFDKLFSDGEKFKIGSLDCEVISLPGHTPACVAYKIFDTIFVGDVIFMPDVGTARTDFPGGSAQESFKSLQKIFAFSDDTKIYTGHDYPTAGRLESCMSTVGEEKEKNILVNKKVSEAAFIANRSKRDEGKPVPKLLLPSIQINLRAGKIGKAEDNGVFYMKIPVML